MTQPDMRHPA